MRLLFQGIDNGLRDKGRRNINVYYPLLTEALRANAEQQTRQALLRVYKHDTVVRHTQ